MIGKIIEVAVAGLLLIASVVGAVKFWVMARGNKVLSDQVENLRESINRKIIELRTDLRACEGKAMTQIKECKNEHDGCNKELRLHLQNKDVHRDKELEDFRFDTLSASLSSLKLDLTQGMNQMEGRIGERLSRIEKTFLNSQGG